MLKRFLPSTLSRCNGHFGVEAVFYSDVMFMKSRLAFIPASCEQMHGCISMKNLGGPAVTLPVSFLHSPLIS